MALASHLQSASDTSSASLQLLEGAGNKKRSGNTSWANWSPEYKAFHVLFLLPLAQAVGKDNAALSDPALTPGYFKARDTLPLSPALAPYMRHPSRQLVPPCSHVTASLSHARSQQQTRGTKVAAKFLSVVLLKPPKISVTDLTRPWLGPEKVGLYPSQSAWVQKAGSLS